MKSIFLLMATLIFSTHAFSQEFGDPSKPTTQEEYNYLTKGYKIQLESGLDMKRGYTMRDYGSLTDGNYQFSFNMLIREQENELSAILVTIKSSVSGKTYYLCIPHNNEELLEQYFDSIISFDSSISKAYVRVLSRYFSRLTMMGFEFEKNYVDK